MNTEYDEPPGHPPQPINVSMDRRLFDLEKERLRLVSQYEEIMNRVEDGDDTGFTLTRITKKLSDVNREIDRVRHAP